MKDSFVDLLLAASEKDETFRDEDVVHELSTFMLAVRAFALVLPQQSNTVIVIVTISSSTCHH
jgi:hypothetical protein